MRLLKKLFTKQMQYEQFTDRYTDTDTDKRPVMQLEDDLMYSRIYGGWVPAKARVIAFEAVYMGLDYDPYQDRNLYRLEQDKVFLAMGAISDAAKEEPALLEIAAELLHNLDKVNYSVARQEINYKREYINVSDKPFRSIWNVLSDIGGAAIEIREDRQQKERFNQICKTILGGEYDNQH